MIILYDCNILTKYFLPPQKAKKRRKTQGLPPDNFKSVCFNNGLTAEVPTV